MQTPNSINSNLIMQTENSYNIRIKIKNMYQIINNMFYHTNLMTKINELKYFKFCFFDFDI